MSQSGVPADEIRRGGRFPRSPTSCFLENTDAGRLKPGSGVFDRLEAKLAAQADRN
jgi:hypothetical protein